MNTLIQIETIVSFNKKLQEQLDKMAQLGKLFRSSLSGNEIWDLYINSFEKDPIFRDPASSEHTCNLCKNFIRRYGNIVTINNSNEIISIFDIQTEGEYENSVKEITKVLKNSKIQDVFFETWNELNSLNYEKCSKTNSIFRLGIDKNIKRYTKEEAEKFGVVKPNEIKTFNHLHLNIPTLFVDMSGKSVETIMGDYRSSKEVFKRAMDEISLDTLNLVKDLIIQGSLLDGTTHLYKVEQFIPLKEQYDQLAKKDQDNWCWVNSYKLPIAKFKNELIGVLCSELSEGEELNKACQSWNKRVDPVNYMKTTAPITKKQIEEAKKFVEENGYEESFDRRFATIDDIKASEILHLNSGKAEIKNVSIFDNVKSTSTRHKRAEFDKIETVSIEKFMSDILPGCTSIEAFLENRLEGNMVSLTTTNNSNSKPIFKWNNNYSWTFNGNLAGKSQIKEEVKSKGGKVDGVLRFSMMWADGNNDNSDLDLHCLEPTGNHIYFSNKINPRTGGNLDIDITQPNGKLAVENITFPSLSKMTEGVYKLFIHQYSARSSKGFKAEIEFNGELYSYTYDKPVSGNIQIAEVTLKNGEFTIIHKLPATDGIGVSKEIYGLESNNFHKVNLVCLSPNHWNTNNVGNKHYFFMLDKAKSPISIRSFHNENLLPELATHRKVLEVLGTQTMINSTDKQLSGLGFNSTVKDEVILKLQGTHKRVIKVQF
jgi:hypothetical protein